MLNCNTTSKVHHIYNTVHFLPVLWRFHSKLPKLPTEGGVIVGCIDHTSGVSVLIEDDNINALIIGKSGVGKTKYYICPSIEYCCATGSSFIAADSVGKVLQTGTIAKEYYRYKLSVIDLRNPIYSNGYNILYQVGKYMDLYKSDGKLEYRNKMVEYAKITTKSILTSDGSIEEDTPLYKAIENLLTAIILIISDYCTLEKRHILSVFSLLVDLFTPSDTLVWSRLRQLINKLPSKHAARQFLDTALDYSEQDVAKVIPDIVSKYYALIPADFKPILGCDNSIDIERFCKGKSAIYLILPEKDTTNNFLASLIVQQLYREMSLVATENGGTLNKRVMLYMDDMEKMPKINGINDIFSATHTQNISIVAATQSIEQLTEKYSEKTTSAIFKNIHCVMFGEIISNSSAKGQDPHRFLVQVDGKDPFITKFNLRFKWGIGLEEDYIIEKELSHNIICTSVRELKNEMEK